MTNAEEPTPATILTSPAPYARVKQAIVERALALVGNGVDRLPAEEELSKQLGVSRATPFLPREQGLSWRDRRGHIDLTKLPHVSYRTNRGGTVAVKKFPVASREVGVTNGRGFTWRTARRYPATA